jgi:DNA-binding transcriptional MerR regulator
VKLFTVEEAAKITGATTRNVQFWSGSMVSLVPPVDGGGQGRRKRFDAEGLAQLTVVDALTQVGVQAAIVAKLLSDMADGRRELVYSQGDVKVVVDVAAIRAAIRSKAG